MKKLSLSFVMAAFIFCGFANLQAADVNNGLNDKYIGETNPAITGQAVDNHIRVLEFVLGTRMTVAQKQIFLKAIETESKNMDTEELNNFLDVLGLAESLNALSSTDAEPIRQMLEKDFDATVSSLEGQNDLAAIQYNKLKKNISEKVAGNENISVSQQSVEALAEYLAFIANPQNPVWPNDLTTNATAMRIRTSFNSYTEEEKSALEDFQLTWYLIRAAWQTATPAQKAAWQKDFSKLGLKVGVDVTSANIKAALSTDVYGDLLDFATKSGIEPIEWSTKTKALIW